MIFNLLLFMKSYDLVETLHDSEMFKPYTINVLLYRYIVEEYLPRLLVPRLRDWIAT